jgi:hypothetical protein
VRIFLAQAHIQREAFFSSNSVIVDTGIYTRQGRRGVDCQALNCGEKDDTEEELHNFEVGGTKGHCNGDLDLCLEVLVVVTNMLKE